MYDQLEKTIEYTGNLVKHQYDFRKERSTVEAIVKHVNTVVKVIDGRRWRGGSKQYCTVICIEHGKLEQYNSSPWRQKDTGLPYQNTDALFWKSSAFIRR